MAETPREGPVDEILRLRRVWPGSAADLFQMLEEQLAVRPRSSPVRLECIGGQTLHGEVVRYQSKSRTVLLVHQGTLSWVDLSQVVAVTLVHADSWLQELTHGQVLGSKEPAPTRLQLRRMAERLCQDLHLPSLEVSWQELPEDDQSARHLHLVLQELGDCWRQIGQDEMGQKALSAIRSLRVEFFAGSARVLLADGVCRVQLAGGPGELLAFEPGALRKKLESAL